MSKIFSPTVLGDLGLGNRVVMAPMTRDRAGEGDVPTALMVEYYRQRASAGLIITEGVQPTAVGKGYWRTPGIYSPQQIEGWRAVADAVHAEGGRIVMQLMHCGRASVRTNKDKAAETIAPSAIQSSAKIPGPDGVPRATDMPRALETHEVLGVVQDYAQAARNAREAGIDGVELHCASGYLPMQFLSSNTNHRIDRYGGSVENRIRFVQEVLDAMSEAIGSGRVGFRICPGVKYNDMNDANPLETYSALLQGVDGKDLAYLHLMHLPFGLDSGMDNEDALEFVRNHWKGRLVVNAGQFEAAETLLEQAAADAVSFGVAFIANPDLVERFRTGAPLALSNRETYYTGSGDDARGYTDYPKLRA